MSELVEASTNETTLAILAHETQQRVMENIDPDDFVIPFIKMVQPLTDTEGFEAKFGDIITSDGNRVLGGTDTPAKFVVVKMLPKTFTVSAKKDGSMFSWVSSEPWDIKLKNEWLFERDGMEHKREKTFNMYIMFEGDTIPSKLSVRGASVKTGAQISTDIMKLTNLGKLPWENFMALTSKTVSKDMKKYAVLQSSLVFQKTEKQAPSQELQKNAAMWEKIVSADPSAINEASEQDAEEIPF